MAVCFHDGFPWRQVEPCSLTTHYQCCTQLFKAGHVTVLRQNNKHIITCTVQRCCSANTLWHRTVCSGWFIAGCVFPTHPSLSLTHTSSILLPQAAPALNTSLTLSVTSPPPPPSPSELQPDPSPGAPSAVTAASAHSGPAAPKQSPVTLETLVLPRPGSAEMNR